MRKREEVSNMDLKNSLLISIQYNSEALDYIAERIKKVEDFIKYNEDDEVSKNELSVLRYIDFTLKYVDDCYDKSLNQLGGILW